MTIEELNKINEQLKAKKELIVIPKSLFTFGLKGRTIVLYDYLSRIFYVNIKNNSLAIFNTKALATYLNYTEENIVESLNELIVNSIIKVKEIKDDNYYFEINFQIFL